MYCSPEDVPAWLLYNDFAYNQETKEDEKRRHRPDVLSRAVSNKQN